MTATASILSMLLRASNDAHVEAMREAQLSPRVMLSEANARETCGFHGLLVPAIAPPFIRSRNRFALFLALLCFFRILFGKNCATAVVTFVCR